MSEVDITIPRECIYKEFENDPGPCPRCGGPLHQISQTYLVATRRGRTVTDSFLVATDFGWFCAACPTVVIDPADVQNFLSFGKPDWDTGSEFAVLGVVDLAAIPPEKAHLALGDDNNPIPLVQFTNVVSKAAAGSKGSAGGPKSSPRKKRPKPAGLQAKQKRKKKRRRS